MEWINEIGQDIYEDDIVNIETQDLDSWRVDRLGNITGSKFGDLIVSDKKGGYTLSKSKTAENLIYKIAWERLLKQGNYSNGLGRLEINSRETNYGTDYENQARLKFEEKTGLQVISDNQFLKVDEWIGGTPDGFVNNDAIIEIKCPYNGGNHLKTLLTGEIYNTDYIYQIQGYLWITGRQKCYFVTYDPDLIDELQLSIIEVQRDEILISAIKEILEMVKEKIKEILQSEILTTKK